MIKISTKEAEKQLRELKGQLSEKQVANATRMAINESVKSAKVQVKRTIRDIYNISNSRIDDKNPKKGLSIKLATNSDMTGQVNAGHIPINLSEASPKFTGEAVATQVKYKNGKPVKGRTYKRSKSKISVEVLKGQRKTLETAFTIGVATHASTGQQFATTAIFARGKKGKPDFQHAKPRLPIDSLSTVSVATAALNTKAQEKTQPKVSEQYMKRLQHHMNRMLKK